MLKWDDILLECNIAGFFFFLKYSNLVNAATVCLICAQTTPTAVVSGVLGNPPEFPTGKGIGKLSTWLPFSKLAF